MAERDEVVGFDRPDANELIRLIGGKTPTRQPQSVQDDTGIRIGYTTAGATARSGTTLGTGTFKLYYAAESGSNRVLTASPDTDDITVYNLSTTAVAATKYIMCLRWGDIWVCNWEEC